ncbi:MAG TPA: 16S rRNA (guanine(527)-N(7))-methyltransferase RsmG, partial [Rhodobacterales bacterium]|nr:16S rRNA (guanine(527)-N(7))-methyltransferase RsmG [Rhodobacterales bacterium]
DLGTGGGFPGLVVSILAAERAPNLSVIAVESDVRKATFLRTVVREAGLQTSIISDRIEALEPLEANILSARALAPLPKLLSLIKPHLAENAEAVFPKGEGYEAEVSESLETWSFRIDTYPSKTNPGAAILKLGDIERV